MEAIPLTASDPELVEVRPMDGQVTFEGYVGSDEGGSYSGTTKGNESKKKTESQKKKETEDVVYNDMGKPMSSGATYNDYSIELTVFPIFSFLKYFNLGKYFKGSIGIASNGGVQLTKKTFGHTFTIHGDNLTNFLIKRAEGSGTAQGQFLNNQKAAQFILDNVGKTANGAINIPIPKGFPARVIMPDGTFRAATHIRLVPGGGGVKTAYPLIH